MSIVLDPSSQTFADNPYPVYEQLREQEEPYPFSDLLLLSRFEDVEAAARNPSLVRTTDSFMSKEQQLDEQKAANWHDMPNHERFVQFSMLDSDGPVHDRLRRLVMKHMSRRFVEKQRTMIETFVSQLLDQLLETKEIDFAADLACHVPGHIIGSLLGVPDEDCEQLRVWSENVVQYFDLNRSNEKKKLAEQSTTEFSIYLDDLIRQRRQRPQDDLVSALVLENQTGALSETELISTCMLILMAGHGSTIDVLGTGLLQLLTNPMQFEQLRSAPGLMPKAVQEMFRIDSPLPFFHRFSSESVEVMGQNFPAGTKFGLLYGSANRDPRAFEEPDKFQPNRDPNRHIAFGRGAHLCLGNHLSRLDMEVIFNMLMDRTRSIELIEKPKFRTGLASRGLTQLKIRLLPN